MITLPIPGDTASVMKNEKGVYHFNDFFGDKFERFLTGMTIEDTLTCTNANAKILKHDQLHVPNNEFFTMKNLHDKLEVFNTTSNLEIH